MLEIKRLPKGALFDVELLQIGSLPETPEPHRHEYYEIFWVLAGKGTQSIDFVQYEMTPNKMFFITPGQVHDVHILPDSIYAISFNAEFIDAQQLTKATIDKLFLQNRAAKPFIELDDVGNKHLGSIIKVVVDELERGSPDNDLLVSLLVSFLRYVTRYLIEQHSPLRSQDIRMLKLLELIDKEFIKHKDTGYYSNRLAMTSKRLNELAKGQFGKTVTQLVHEKVIVEARRMLTFTEKTVKTIAIELGFDDVSYFCRFFKRLTGLPPQRYREKWFAQPR